MLQLEQLKNFNRPKKSNKIKYYFDHIVHQSMGIDTDMCDKTNDHDIIHFYDKQLSHMHSF
jgi:hypothetical protein